jgi:hypothetical protein
MSFQGQSELCLVDQNILVLAIIPVAETAQVQLGLEMPASTRLKA